MPDSQSELRKRNLAFFAKAAPEVHSRFASPIGPDGASFSPPGPGKIPSRRFTIPAPDAKNLDRYTFDTISDMLASAIDQNIPVIDWPRTERSFYLILLGVHHQQLIQRMLDQTQCMSAIFIEPDPAAFAWSLEHIDWPELIADVQARGGTFDFVFDPNPATISATIWRTMRFINPTCTDGAMFTAFAHPELARDLTARLGNDLALSYTSLGFFYDESLMIHNTHRNLSRGDARIFQRRHEDDPGCPVFVVASGPSLDDSIETIKKHADHAIIVSCGSALRPLLVNGTIPDFQIETENAGVSPLTRQMADEHDLSKVILVASTTIDPDVLPSFRDVVFYFRSSLSPYPVFAPSHASSLFMPDPTVGNAGLSLALELGFKDVYLFGMDCGSRNPARHHSSDAYHYSADAGDIDVRYDMQVDANFGGRTWTNHGLFMSIVNLIELLKIFGDGRNVRNCSDGAMIDGATPLKPVDIDLSPNAGMKQAAMQSLIETMPPFADTGQDTSWPGDAFADAVHSYCAQIREHLTQIDNYEDKSYQRKLMEVLQPPVAYFAPPPKGVQHGVNILMRGTLFCILMFFERYLSRVAYHDDLKRFGDIGVKSMVKGLDLLERDAIERLGGSAPKAPPPLDTIKHDAGTRLQSPPAPSRNSPCPCGSGNKFKHCHGKTA